MNDRKRHLRVHRFFLWLLKDRFPAIWGYQAEPVDVCRPPYLVVANHNTDLDPLLLSLTFPDHMYFVASEHIFRKGFISWLLMRYLAPISRMKGSTDASTALDVLRRLKRGSSIGLFAEGDRSYNGVTGPVMPATGKLVRAAGVPLVTFRFEGGYLSTPRWGASRRRGYLRGRVVGVYPPEQLKAMKPEQINALIGRDISEDAFDRQALEHVPFKGKRLAEHLEYALFLCPECGRIGSLRSEDDRFFCTCGLSVTYTEYGFFAGANTPFTCVRDWDRFQLERLRELYGQTGDSPLLQDEGQTLYHIENGHRARAIETGLMEMTHDTLRVGEHAFAIRDISSMALYASTNLIFTCAGAHYEVRSDPTCCRRKYKLLYDIATEAKTLE